MKPTPRVATVCVLVALLMVWLLSGWLWPGMRVDVVRAKRDRIVQFVDERGVTRLPETYLITTPSAGRVAPVEYGEGTPVKKGQVVARFVPIDTDLDVREGETAVDRLKASIEEADDTSVERTALKQTEEFVKSMEKTVEAAAERMRSGKARLEYAIKELERVRQLFTRGARTEDDLDRALLQHVQGDADYRQDVLVHAAMLAMQAATNLLPEMVQQYIARKGLTKAVLEKQLAEAKVRLEEAELNRTRGSMTSPIDGVVLARFVTSEGHLPAGTRLLEIGRLEDLEVEADVLSVDVVGAKPGDQVEIYGPAIGTPSVRGTVARVYPAGFTKVSSLGVEQQRVKVIARFKAADLDRVRQERNLGVGYRVRVRIETAERPDALVVPRSALFRGPYGAWQVYAVRRGHAEIVDLQVGILNDELAEVTGGLSDGDLVVPFPDSNLTDGERVTPVLRVERPSPAMPSAQTSRTNGD